MLVGYARISTLDQYPSLQTDALREAGCERIFVEKASGGRPERPQVKTALEFLRKNDTLVVWKLSRLARSLREVIQTGQDMQVRNIDLWVLTQNIDTSTPEGRLFFRMTAAFDEFQRELIVEYTRAGLAAANRHGRRGGEPRSMDDERIRLAEALLRDTEDYPFASDVIKQLNIGKTAFYRYFPPERIRTLRQRADPRIPKNQNTRFGTAPLTKLRTGARCNPRRQSATAKLSLEETPEHPTPAQELPYIPHSNISPGDRSFVQAV